MAARDWRFLRDLALAAGRANSSRHLARSLGEALGPSWRVCRVQIHEPGESVEAVPGDGNRWIARPVAPRRRIPSSPAVRALASGRRLTLPIDGQLIALWLEPGAPRFSTSEAFLGALVDVVRLALDRQRVVRKVARLSRRAHSESRELRAVVDRLSAAPPVVAASEVMQDVVDRAEMVARFDTPVLITGESGSGKEVIARLIHRRSTRAAGPFVQVNCGAIPDGLVESELFGHRRGAFTGAERDHRGVFERADGGTLLLDEVGDLPLSAQVKLLRVLQERSVTPVGGERSIPVDARIIAATHRSLRAMVETGAFREDLLYRLDVFPIAVPALRDRAGDLPGLVADLLDALSARLGTTRPAVSQEDLARLGAHRWPGNVRELANVLEAALVCGGGERLELPESFAELRSIREPVRPFDEACRAAIEAALESSRGKIYGPGGAAERLALNPATLQSKMRKLGIDRADFTP